MTEKKTPRPGKHEVKSLAYNRSKTRKISIKRKGQKYVSVGKAERRRAKAQPDQISPHLYITGRYQEKNGLFNFHINQAGTHIECLYANVISARTRKHAIIRFGGDYKKTEAFLCMHTLNPGIYQEQ